MMKLGVTEPDLFNQNRDDHNPLIQLRDAELLYYPAFFDKETSDRYFKSLMEKVVWKQDTMKIYGKEVLLPRLSAWFGDKAKPYKYSGITLQSSPWTIELLEMKEKVEAAADMRFTSVLINRYRNGQDYVGWHADSEKELQKNPVIASLNFGATRTFQLRRADDHTEKFEVELKHGTLLVMRGAMQHFWQHQVPKTSAKIGERLNLTFRFIL